MYIVENTLDDVLIRVLSKLLASKNIISPGRGRATEIVGTLIRIKNPRGRISRTEKRGKLFSSLGELLWYLAKSDELKFIEYYIPLYVNESEDGVTVKGAYGPRLFRRDSIDQISRAIRKLRENPDSRNAVVQLFDATDLNGNVKNPPCTCTMQFFARSGRLSMMTHMRSNDAYKGLPHDVFAFTMLQEIVAVSLNLPLGVYDHAVGSLHLYSDDRRHARELVAEGWQDPVYMPRMTKNDVWKSIDTILTIERMLRAGSNVDLQDFDLSPYWADIARLLKVFAVNRGDSSARKTITMLRAEMVSRVFDPYIHGRMISTRRFQEPQVIGS